MRISDDWSRFCSSMRPYSTLLSRSVLVIFVVVFILFVGDIILVISHLDDSCHAHLTILLDLREVSFIASLPDLHLMEASNFVRGDLTYHCVRGCVDYAHHASIGLIDAPLSVLRRVGHIEPDLLLGLFRWVAIHVELLELGGLGHKIG